MDEIPWCVLGDFNAVVHQGDRMGGLEVNDGENKGFCKLPTPLWVA